jgi:polyhydroxyalkanoate synthesis regulator phasin
VKQQLESLVSEMVDKGILFTEARREFEKKFIARVLQQHRGNLSKSALYWQSRDMSAKPLYAR